MAQFKSKDKINQRKTSESIPSLSDNHLVVRLEDNRLKSDVQKHLSVKQNAGTVQLRVTGSAATVQLMERGLELKARAKSGKAKARKRAAQQKQENKNWWLHLLLGGMMLSGAAIAVHKSMSGSVSGEGGVADKSEPPVGNKKNPVPKFGNNTASSVDTHFHKNEMAKIQHQRGLLNRQPLTASVIRHQDALDHQEKQLHTMNAYDYTHKATTPLDPSKGKGHIVGIVGLPGSGKSVLQSDFAAHNYTGAEDFDDIGQNPKQYDQDYRWWNPFSWPRKLPPPLAKWPDQRAETSVKTHAEQGTNVVMSDPEFVKKETRAEVEKKVGRSVKWAYFENNPSQAKDNARFRKERATSAYDKSRNVDEEMAKVDDLSSKYEMPEGTATHPVVNARKKYKRKKNHR